MPAHPVGHLNGKLSPSEHDKVGSGSVLVVSVLCFRKFRLAPYINDSTRTDFKFCVFFPLLFSPLPSPPPPPPPPSSFLIPVVYPSVRVCACAPLQYIYIYVWCVCVSCLWCDTDDRPCCSSVHNSRTKFMSKSCLLVGLICLWGSLISCFPSSLQDK